MQADEAAQHGRRAADVLAAAEARLAAAGIDTARLDAEVLLAGALGWTRAALLARLHDPVPPEAATPLRARLLRRARREPLAYITGEREFWSLPFSVTRDTLIPRPETEILVEAALELIAALPAPRVLDIGTGSGCVAVAIAHERAAAVTAIDVSPAALRVARANAQRHGVENRIAFVPGDVRVIRLPDTFDLIAANPPYVPRRILKSLPPEISRWEPRAALDGGADGLDMVGTILARGQEWLRRDGWLAMEIGSDQADAALALARERGWREPSVRPDLAGLPRVLVARI